MNFISLYKKLFTIVYARFLPLCIALFTVSAAFGQAPANDDPCGAVDLTPAATCTYVPGTTVNATASTGSGAPACANFNNGTTRDVWYKATVPPDGVIAFDMQAGSITDGGMAVYRGNNCNNPGSLVLLTCDDNSSANVNMPKATVAGLPPGVTVFVRVWAKNNGTGTFGICATIPAPPPVNDEPCNAIELPVGATCSFQTFTNESASGTTTVAAPVCAGYLGGDVWFKVIVPAGTTALVFDTRPGVVLDGGMEVYSGSSCEGALTALACDDDNSVNGNMPSLIVGGLVPGDTVWVRFWEKDNNNNGTFDICVTLPPPPPANDDPCNAIELIVNADCVYQNFTNNDATASSPTIPEPGCGDYQGGDVWFKAVVPAEGSIVFDGQAGIVTDGSMAIYRGTCNNLTLLACDQDASSNGNMPKITLGGLAPGDTLWIRFWEEGNDNNGTFGICASIPPPPPANDEVCNAIELTPDIACNYQTFSNQDATGSIGAADPGCAGYSGGDVWFKVVVPAEGALAFDSQEGTMTDGGMALYSGTSCDAALTLLTCNDDASVNGDMPSFTVGGLTPGDTLYVRFWENGNDDNGTFGICVSIPPPAPVNDEPCNAIELTPDLTCNYQTFSNESATATIGLDDPGCSDYQGGDVWFKVVVPAEGGLIFDSQEGVMTDGAMALYTGTCDNLTLLDCNDDGSDNGLMPALSAFGLNPGDTIFVRFFEFGNDNNGTFGICVRIPPPPPVNDDPCNSIEIPVQSSCNYQTFTNESATPSTSVDDPGCADYQGGDVWFKAVVPAEGAIAFDTEDDVMFDGGMAVYSGTCDGGLTLLSCDDNASPNGAMPKVTVAGLTPGDTVYVRLWSNFNDNNGNFGICATIPPPPPTNDDPCTAFELIPDSTCNFQTFTNENSTNTNLEDPGCAGYEGSDVWFKVVVPSGGALIFDSQEGTITDGGMAVYSGTCGSLTLLDCDDDGSNNGLMPFISVGGLTPGDTLYVRFWEFFNDNNGDFGICVRLPPPGPANDDPCGALELPVNATCTYQTFTNESSFGSVGVPAPGCANYQGGDVWFKAVVPVDGAITFDTREDVMTDGGMAVYTGNCNNLTLIECDDNDGAGNMPKMTIGGLTAGDTVWIRVWEAGNNNNGTFGICLTIPPPPPANDNPCGAINIPVNDSCTYLNFSNEGSFGTASVPAPPCGGYSGADVWFSVIAPAAGAVNINTQAGTIVDAAMAIYVADSCNGTMTLLACDDNGSENPDMPYITATGILSGTPIYIRVWSKSGALNAGTFGICAVVPPLQPATFSFTCARDTVFSCGGGDSCFTLEAIIPDIHALTDRYAINPLSSAGSSGCFNPYIDPGSAGPSTDLLIDDRYTDVIQLPFSFPFFGTNYNSLIASTNGYVSFDVSEALNFSHWDITDGTTPRNLPSGDDFYDRALIMGPYHDLDPGQADDNSPNMRIKYNVTGTAPHRRWTLSFYKVPLFQTACNSLIENTHQIVLYECSGMVEVFIFDMQNCLTWNDGRAMVGMQDFTRTRGIMAPGRAASDAPWGRIGMNESWRFVPIGGPTLFKRVELFDTSGNFLATGDTSFLDSASLKVNFRNLCSLNRLPAGLNTLIIRSTYQNPCDLTREQVGADTITIFIPNLKVNFDVTNGQCGNPGSVEIHLSSGVQPVRFSSDSGLTWQSDSVFSNLATGTYYFKVQDGAGCARDTIIDITSITGMAATFTVTNATCNGDSGTVVIDAGGVRPIRYSSDSGLTYQYDSVFTLPAGSYNFHLVDTNGCERDSVIVITEPLPISATYVDSVANCGNTGTISVVSVSGGTGPYTYSFDGGNYLADTSQSTFAAGSHTVSIKDANGCTKDTVITVTSTSSLAGIYADSAVSCNGAANGTISVVSVLGGVAPFTYSFDSSPYASDTSLSTFAAGPHTVSIKDATGCTRDTIINILQPDPVFGLYTVRSTSCNGSSDGTISVTAVAGGNAPFTYSFDSGTYGSDSSLSTFAAGPHTISIKDANGCTKDTTIVVDEPAPIVATYAVTDAKCFGGNGSIVIDVLSGGTPNYSYSSDGGTNFQPGDSFAVVAGPYVVRIRDANGCTKDTNVVVAQPTAIAATYAVTSPKCFAANSGSIIITASGGTPNYVYSNDGGTTTQADDSFAVAAGTYVVRIQDANGCTKDTTIIVTEPQQLAATAAAASSGCNTTSPTGQITVTATGGTPAYEYSNGGAFQSSNVFAGLAPNNFNITVRDANGCTVVTGAIVGVVNDLTLQTRQDTTICGEITVVLNTTTNAQSVSWFPTTFLDNPVAVNPGAVNPTVTTEYVVTATLGTCTRTDTVKIIVTDPPLVDAGSVAPITKGLDAQLNATISNAVSYTWTPTTYLNNVNTLSPISVMPQQTITYTLTATNAEGCSNSDTVTVTVLPYCIKVKNAFSPNGDGINDTWMVYDQFDCLRNVRVQVFNRYGSRVYQSTNYRNEWRGTYGGSNLPDATYYYIIDYVLSDGRDYQVRGDVTILR